MEGKNRAAIIMSIMMIFQFHNDADATYDLSLQIIDQFSNTTLGAKIIKV